LGGTSKPSLIAPNGRTALANVIDVCRQVGARQIVVVGPVTEIECVIGFPLPEDIWVVQEEPPFSGPANAVAAGVLRLPLPGLGDATLVLACDMPGVLAGVLALLAVPLVGDGVIGVSGGHDQWMLGLYRTSALRRACQGLRPNTSMRDLLGGLDLTRVMVDDGVVDDLDSLDDLSRWGYSRPRTGSVDLGD